jgi:dihydrofolate reductase
MHKLVVNEFISLDRVVQAPGAADEDTTGGFAHGGWHLRYFDQLAQPLNTKPKYVASRTLPDPLQPQNSTRLEGNVAAAVAAPKQDGADLHLIGSTRLAQTLIQHGLVDELRLMIDPLVLGGGKRLFPEDGALRPLRLVDSQATSTGAILATYAPADS